MNKRIKKAISDFFKKIGRNIGPIFRWTYRVSGVLYTAYSLFLAILSFQTFETEDITLSGWLIAVAILIPVVAFLISLIFVVAIIKTTRIWKKGKNTVTASYGDLISMSFKKRNNERKIVVINVNTTFDVLVEETSEYIKNPLVNPKSVHGQWITNFCEQQNITPEDLNKRIQNNLKLNGYKGEKIEKERGNNIEYKLGTVAVIDGDNNTTFFLLAISSFDDKNNAHVTKRELRNSIDELLDFYNSKGQMDPLYIPLMGTGNSRAGLTHQQSLSIIKNAVLTSGTIVGSINIVVYNGDKSKVSIFK